MNTRARSVTPDPAEEGNAEDQDALQRAAEANQRRNESRLARMNSIADSVDDERADDGMRATDGDRVIEETPEEREARELREQERSEQQLNEMRARELQTDGQGGDPDEQQPDEKLINGVRHYLVIVNGREKWLTLQQLRETSQKVDSADEYLATAKQSARSAAELVLSPSRDVPARLGKDELRKLLAAATLGDEEAIEQLASVIAQPSAVTPDVVQQIDQRVSFRTELAQLEAEHRDILDDPWGARLMRDRLQEMKQENPQTPLATAYRTIGKEIREAFPQRFKGAASRPTGRNPSDIRERKRTFVNAPTPAGRAPVGEEGDEELDYEQTVAAAISDIAKSRGQPEAIRRPQQQSTGARQQQRVTR